MTRIQEPRDLPHELRRCFELVIFDWDGTAVPDRSTPTPELERALTALLRRGAWIAPVTGTNVDNLERQSLLHIPAEARSQKLVVSTNRGSEVWAYDPSGARRSVYRRVATEIEERQLSKAAESLALRLRERGVETTIIYDRMNRRKIDLIPLPEWSAPPKSQIGALIAATRSRVRAGGFAEIGDVISLAEELSVAAGLEEPRITSDGKYVEIGLTDKGDSVTWLLQNVARTNGIDRGEIVIAGDEFGDVGGFCGSDAKMLIPAAKDAVFISVGPEPAGVPNGVISVGGGPEAFVEYLDWQLALRMT
jgi:hypothetical protein